MFLRLTVSLAAVATVATAVDDLTTTYEVLANPVYQYYGVSGAPTNGWFGVTEFRGRIYGGYGDTNNRFWKPLLAYDLAAESVVNDMPGDRLAHSLVGSHFSAFVKADGELYLLDYDNQSGSENYVRNAAGWRMHEVGSSDGAGKGHDAGLVRHQGKLFRDRGAYLIGGHLASISADGINWSLAERGAGGMRTFIRMGIASSLEFATINGALYAFGEGTSSANLPSEGGPEMAIRFTGDIRRPWVPVAWDASQLPGGALPAQPVSFKGKMIVFSKTGGAVYTAIEGAAPAPTPFSWSNPEGTPHAITSVSQTTTDEVDGVLLAKTVYNSDVDGDYDADEGTVVVRESSDGVNWSERFRFFIATAEHAYGITKVGSDYYTTYAGNLIRLRPGSTNSPPSIQLSGAALIGSTATLTASASDADGIAKVEFFAGVDKVGEDATSPYAITWSDVPAGTWSITARAVDTLGAMTSSVANGTGSTAYRTISRSQSLATADHPQVALFDLNAARRAHVLQANARCNLYATGSDPQDAKSSNGTVTTSDIAKVEFFANGVKIGEDLTFSNSTDPDSWNFDWLTTSAVPRAPGAYSIVARATDRSGHSTDSEPVSLRIEANPGLPATAITSPASGTVVAAGQSLTFTVSASDAADGVDRSDLFITESGVVYLPATSPGECIGSVVGATGSVVWRPLRSATYQVVARTYDQRGGMTASAPVSVVVTTTNPLVTPSGFSATLNSDGRTVDLAWSGVGSGETAIEIQRTSTAGTNAVWQPLACLSAGTASYRDLWTYNGANNALSTSACRYRYRIRTFDDQGASPWADSYTGTGTLPLLTNQAETMVAGTVGSFTATAVAGSTAAVDLAWTPASGATIYAVVGQTATLSSRVIAWLPGDATGYRHQGLPANSTWTYTVHAMNGFTQHRDFDAGPYLNPGKRSTPSASRTVTTGGFGTNRALAVVDGSGDGSYCTGAFVGISADAAAPGTVFVCWTSSTPGVAFADHLSPHTSIFMPESAATVTATYRTLPGGGGGNTPPTISDVASRTINEDAVTGAIPVAIGDAETPAGGLLLTASSSNQALVPNANIVLGGSGANRTATITPVANQSGTAVIAMTVTDVSGATASDTFLLTVTAVNDLPTIGDLEYLQMDEDTSTGAVVVDVGDLETSAGSLLLAASSSNQALVPNANIVLGGSGANRTLAITPAVNQSGTTTITVIVTDGNGATASDSFIVAVVAQNDPPSCTTAPWVTGVAMHGQTLGVTTGIWVDHDGTVAAYAYQWERADSDAGANTVLIVGAQMGTYQPTSEDVGKVLRVRVTATDDGAPAPGASAHAYSAYTAQISALGNLPPTIGDIADLTTGEDTVPGWIAVTVSDSESAAGSLVLAASSSDQTLLPDANIALGGSGENRTVNLVPAADRSGMVAVTLTVTDGDGATASRVFLLTVTAVNDAPVNTTPPSITGTTTQGQSLGGTTGDWHDPEGTVVSYARQWQRADDSGGANAASIPGATGSIYVLTAADVGKVLRLRVTATDHGLSFPAASTTAWSGWTAVVAAMPITATPVIDVTSGLGTATPTISGTATTGATIRIYEGSEHIATTQAGMDGSWEWQASVPLFAGWHSITFTATAVGHGESLPTAPITVSLAAHTIQVVPGSGGGGCGAGGLAGVMVSWLAVAGLLRRSRKDSAVSGRDP